MYTNKYTLVAHSGLPMAVEMRFLQNKSELRRVNRAGGVVFTDYKEATEAEEAENYPPEVLGIHPRVRGHFVKEVVQGLQIYIPKKETETNEQPA